MSYERSTSNTSYISKRIRRIYPAYFTIVMLCAFGLWVISANGAVDYFSADWFKYVGANLTFLNFLHPALPGVFEGNRLPHVNGALWTLKIEVMFYITVPIFVYLFRKLSRIPVMAFTYFFSIGYMELMELLARHYHSEFLLQLARQLPGQLSYFMAGAFLFYYLSVFERFIGVFAAGAVGVFVFDRFFQLPLLEPMALAVVVVFFGLFIYVGNFGKFGDFSYGIYIVHFPMIQLILHLGWFHKSPWQFLIAVLLMTIVVAMAMWHLVEKRFLLRTSYYVLSTR